MTSFLAINNHQLLDHWDRAYVSFCTFIPATDACGFSAILGITIAGRVGHFYMILIGNCRKRALRCSAGPAGLPAGLHFSGRKSTSEFKIVYHLVLSKVYRQTRLRTLIVKLWQWASWGSRAVGSRYAGVRASPDRRSPTSTVYGLWCL